METKAFSISSGPKKRKLFSALYCYPKKYVDFELAFSQTHDSDIFGNVTKLPYLATYIRIYVYEISALLAPLELDEKADDISKIVMIKNSWIIRGFVDLEGRFVAVSMNYNIKSLTGVLHWPYP
ncbi:MAG: hypothetical protein FJZ43_01085 [Candidatus Staskawiczbacteria bacterium]|nr:hypothetical protein [Candidatus Staskawiczbacteria bacterium]